MPLVKKSGRTAPFFGINVTFELGLMKDDDDR